MTGQKTKAAISNIVREVVRSYQFTSFAELDAVQRNGLARKRRQPDARK